MSTFGGILIGGAIGAVAVFASRSKSKKEIEELKRTNSSLYAENEQLKNDLKAKPQESNSKKEEQKLSRETIFEAKKAFVKYIDKFSPYLLGLEVNDFNRDGFRDEIISVNNKALIEFWRFYQNKRDELIAMLGRWGISFNNTGSFVCNQSSTDYYVTENGDPLEIGVKYKVLKAFWLQTSNVDNSQRTLVKGVVKKA